MGITMVVPFFITLTLSVSNAYDYQRFSVVPRYFYSDEDRFVKYLTGYFNDYSGWQAQMAAYFPDVPETWSSWTNIGHDTEGADRRAETYLRPSSQELGIIQTKARDYA